MGREYPDFNTKLDEDDEDDVVHLDEHLDELNCSDAAVCGLSLISWEPWCLLSY